MMMQETVAVPNELESLPVLYETVERFVCRVGGSNHARRSLCLIVEELFANTVSYGYPDGEVDEINLTLGREGEMFNILLVDRAAPFDNGEAPEVNLDDATVENMQIGGLGLFLVHQLAHSVTNSRANGVNRTALRFQDAGDPAT